MPCEKDDRSSRKNESDREAEEYKTLACYAVCVGDRENVWNPCDHNVEFAKHKSHVEAEGSHYGLSEKHLQWPYYVRRLY